MMIRLPVLCLVALSIVQVVAPEERFSKNVVVIVDTSSSMNISVDESIAAFRAVTQQPIDEMNLAVVAFANRSALWDWHKLPDEEALRDAENWLESMRCVLGDETDPIGGFIQALRLEKKELTVVLISDGHFWSPRVDEVIGYIENLQEEREHKKLDRAVICCIGVHDKDMDSLIQIANIGKGGYFKWKARDG